MTALDDEVWRDTRSRRGGAGAVAAPVARETTIEPCEKTPGRPDRPWLRVESSLRREDCAEQVRRMHAVVVAGEHSWGGGVFEELGCRPLMEMAGRPLLVHILEWLGRQGIRSAGICVNNETGAVRHCLGDGQRWGLSLQYYTDVMPRGPAGCVRDAAIDSGADDILVLSGMVIPQVGIGEAFQQHRRTDADITVIASPGRGSSLEASGVYIFGSSALDHIGATGYQDIKETLLPQVCRAGGRVQLWAGGDGFPRITDLQSYVLLNRRLVEESLESFCGSDYIQMGNCWVHRACEVDPSVRFIGPAVIGPGCRIDAGAVIVGPTSIGMGCQIGTGAVVCRSIVWALSRIGRDVFVDNCLLSHGSVLGDMERIRDAFWTKSSRWGVPSINRHVTLQSAVHRLAS